MKKELKKELKKLEMAPAIVKLKAELTQLETERLEAQNNAARVRDEARAQQAARILADLAGTLAGQAPESPEAATRRAIIEKGFAQAARDAHPDAGGSNEQMHELTRAKDDLLRLANVRRPPAR